MPCMCGDTQCPSCGVAQGTLDSDRVAARVHDPGELYRFAVKEWGRCTGKVYIDGPDGKARPVGWVFVGREKYEDTGETYLREVWVTLYERADEVTRTKHYFYLDGRR